MESHQVGSGEEVESGEKVGAVTLLPWRQLLTISVYWLGISAVWGGYEIFGQTQVKLMVGAADKGFTIGILEFLGALVAIAVQPTVGVISDYTTSRWGRRKPYIITGAIGDLVLLTGLALIAVPEPPPGTWDGAALVGPGVLLTYAGIFLLLQLSSNVAQGPFQGYVPDLVPEPQVGMASGAMA